MVTATRSEAGRWLRAWWPELLCALMLTLIAFAGQKDDGLFSVFCALIGAIFWLMGFRHRHHPALDAIHETYELTKKMAEADDAAREPAPPRLTLHRGGKAHT